MDYRLYHAVNAFVLAHSWLGHLVAMVEIVAVPLFAVVTVRSLAPRPAARPPQVEARVRVRARLGGARAPRRARDRRDLDAPATVRGALLRPRLGRPVARSVVPLGPRERGVRDRVRDPSLRPDGRRRSSSPRRRSSPSDGSSSGRTIRPTSSAGCSSPTARRSSSFARGRPTILRLVRLVERITDPIVAPVWRRACPPSRRPSAAAATGAGP